MYEIPPNVGALLKNKLAYVSVSPYSWWFVTRLTAFVITASTPAPLWVEYYEPFISAFLREPSLDPWSTWQSGGGVAQAFPYGWPLVLMLSIAVALGSIMLHSSWLGYLILLCLIDFSALLLLKKLGAANEPRRFIETAYAVSPVPIIAIFFIGSTDYIPLLFLIGGLLAIKGRLFWLAGSLVALAVASKFILVAAVFAFLIYLWRSQASTPKGRFEFLWAFLLSVSLASSPIFFSEAFRSGLNSSTDATGPLTWGIASLDGRLLLLPVLVTLGWFMVYQLRRMNFQLLSLSVGAPLLLVASLPGAPLGWAMWALPLFITMSGELPKRFKVLAMLAINFAAVDHLINQRFLLPSGLRSLLIDSEVTASFLLAAITIYLFWRELVFRSDFVRLHSRPCLILISGDSGAGKDTLAEGLAKNLGISSSVRISGDDYHRWDRGEGAWDYLTHLNPESNELSRFHNDILSLASGMEIRNGSYDHSVGKRLSSKTAQSREFVIASGLHALLIQDVNRLASLRIFLEMSDELRTDLKISRDTSDRGHSSTSVIESINSRKRDSELFISPQRENADLQIWSDYLRAVDGSKLTGTKTLFTSEAKLFDNQLVSELNVTCGLEVAVERGRSSTRTITVAGSTDAISLSLSFENIEPRISKILGDKISWDEGPAGLVQMVSMVYLANSLRRERLI
tara:strand:+ start:7275 stop:9326 length:2052 start_codon:yes stop_codon:yes gene_type:complete